jgi:hypothetical protein
MARGVYLWALLMPGILWLGRRFPIERRNWVRRVALHLLTLEITKRTQTFVYVLSETVTSGQLPSVIFRL